ncbi:MAG TPA: NADPH-dependent F420 reductase [Actinomycetes bacterium]|nr:NADPH-dependent F420 reductase [Actinomycetes bacterium]
MSGITIIGTGNMARGIATRAVAGGNDVQILSRDSARAAALADEVGKARSGELGDPITGDIVILALYYDVAKSVIEQYGNTLDGKVVVDISNPVDTATFAGLVVPADSSAAQEIAALVPSAAVVKAFNTTFAGTLAAGEVEGQPLDVLIAGDDDAAKRAVSELVESAGLRPLDVGDLSKARWLEGLGFLHIGLQLSRGTNFATAVKLIGG